MENGSALTLVHPLYGLHHDVGRCGWCRPVPLPDLRV